MSDLTWSSQQLTALEKIDSWLDRRTQPYFYLAGYAGTGKSTIAGFIGRNRNKVVFAAFTGKAASVMRQMGCEGARTIDSLIYHPEIEASCTNDPPCGSPPCNSRCRYLRERIVGRTLNQDSSVGDAELCIVDEVSMVGGQMGRDLLSFNTPVLVLGDVAQLPSIGDAGFFTRREPDYQLTEVHRQARGSPVIQLATRAREGKRLRCGSYGDSAVVPGMWDRDLLEFDQIICGTHRTRHEINCDLRKALGFSGPTPQPGEKVICLKNNRSKGLLNGTMWTVLQVERADRGFVAMVVENDEGDTVGVIAPVEGFTSRDGSGSDLPQQPFAFGYAITCHKAQGSQWDSVLVVDESAVFREHRSRWLYTSITRAVKQVVVTG
jgi:exodeoxyribonuclease-5